MATEPMDIGLPEHIQVRQEGTYMEIVRTWFGARTVFLTAFAVFWDGFLVFWYRLALQHGGPSIMIWIPLLHVAVGIGITYAAIAGWLNRTVIHVGHDVVSVRHVPLPFFPAPTLDATNIKQIYAGEKVTYSRGGSTTTYEVRAITRDGRNVRLVSGLPVKEQALYIEQATEKYLSIPDEPVKGEL